MALIETAVLVLGTAVAKTACGVWFADSKLAEKVGEEIVDVVAGRLVSTKDQRKFRRVWEQAAEVVAERLEPMIEREYPDVPENEKEAAVLAAADTFAAARLTDDDLYRHDLDAGYLDRYLRQCDPDRAGRAQLAGRAGELYDRVLHQSCAYMIEVVRSMPTASTGALAEVLRRERQILDALSAMLDRLGSIRGSADFERDYRQLVVKRLDRVNFFGASLTEASRVYPLSVAYFSLTTTSADADGRQASNRVDELLSRGDRVFIRGQAGIGKTTLLQWIAVRSALGDFPEHLSAWNNTIPFFLPLRRYSTGDLPTPGAFAYEIGRHIAEEMPPTWVQSRLREGSAVVLIDGVDELTEGRRPEVRQWISELIEAFPRSKYVVTSRPAAAAYDWLSRDDFLVAELEPMARWDVAEFVHRWHEAMRQQCSTSVEAEEISRYEAKLRIALDQQRHLRQVSGYPLLCALLCALHRDRRGQLPGSRMEVYAVALEMLLERRDSERDLAGAVVATRTQKMLLLQDIALWLIRNDWSDAGTDAVLNRLRQKLASMPSVTSPPDAVYRFLLERSGLLREPVDGRADFVHRTFQEYLAAKQAVDEGSIGELIGNAHLDQWHEVVVMAAGHASTAERIDLLRGLLRRGNWILAPKGDRDTLRLVALACLELSPEYPPEIERDVQEATRSLLPPMTENAVAAVGRAGRVALDLLGTVAARTPAEKVAVIRGVSAVGDPDGLAILRRLSGEADFLVVDALLHAWRQFDEEEYAETVLQNSPLYNGALHVEAGPVRMALRHLRHLRRLSFGADFESSPDLSFVAHLAHLEELEVPGAGSLEPLRGVPLRRLYIRSARKRPSPERIDISPLHGNDVLQDLIAYFPARVGKRPYLPALTDLEMDVMGLRWFADGGASPVERLVMTNWYADRLVESIDFVAHWAPTLLHLNIQLDIADPGSLSALTNLKVLVLRVHSQRDLQVLPSLPLERVGLQIFSEGVDLMPLAAIPTLRKVVLGGPALQAKHAGPLIPLIGQRPGFEIEVQESNRNRGRVQPL